MAFISAYWAWLAQLSGDSTTAVSRAESTIALATEHSFATWRAAGYIHLTAGLCQLGRLESGLAGLEATIVAWRAAGAGLMLPYFLSQLASAKLASGDPASAEDLVEEALRLADANGERVHEAELLRLRARIRSAVGASSDEIVRDLRESVRVAVRHGALVFALRGLIDLTEHGVSGVECDGSYLRLETAINWWRGRTAPPELSRAAELLGSR